MVIEVIAPQQTSNSKNFIMFCFFLGLALLAVGVLLFVLPDVSSPSYQYDSNYRGIFVITNDSSTINFHNLTLDINTVENPPELLVHYEFKVEIVGTYNCIIILPFDVIPPELYPYNEFNYSSTPFGTAFWAKMYIDNPEIEQSRLAKFAIKNTFQSGENGDYIFSLPLTWDYEYNTQVEQLKKELDLNYNVPQPTLEIMLFISSEYDEITQLSPPPYSLISNFLTGNNKTSSKIVWKLNSLDESNQQFIVSCKDRDIIEWNQTCILVAGFFISAGIGFWATALYDKIKEKDIQKQLEQKKAPKKEDQTKTAEPFRERWYHRIIRVNKLSNAEKISLRSDYRSDIRTLDDQNFKIVTGISTITFAIITAGTVLNYTGILYFFYLAILIVNFLAVKMLLKNRISVLEKTWIVFNLEAGFNELKKINPFNFSMFEEPLSSNSAYQYMITVHKVLTCLGFAWAAVFQLNVEESIRLYSKAIVSFNILGNNHITLESVMWFDLFVPFVILVFFGFITIFVWRYSLVSVYKREWNRGIWATNPKKLEDLKKKFNNSHL